jgi:tetratricopeptide (TPR) repeat protein
VTPYPACTRTPTDGDTAAAKGAFQAGNASFNEADYERAINYWEDAYRRDCTAHANLLNLARAYELNSQKLHAVNALETYLVRKPGSPDEDQIKRRIEKLREQPSADTAPVVAATVEPPPPPAPVSSAQTDVTSAPETTTSKRSIVPLVVAGAGGVVAIVGGVLYANARADFNDAESKCPAHTNCPDDIAHEGNDANSRSKVGGWVMGAGGVVLVGGVVWYFVQKPSTTTASAPHGVFAHVTPSVGPSYGGLHVFGSF